MSNLDTSNWKWFKIEKLFKKPKINKMSAIPEIEGSIPFISSTSINNGISSFVEEKPSYSGLFISVSTNGSCFDCFVQKGAFCVSNDVEILVNENLNENHLFFVASILKLEKYRYDYGRKPKNNKVFNTNIKLPATISGDPDWQFMEEYIRGLREREREREFKTWWKFRKTDHLTLDIINWKLFKIDDIFNIKNGFGITKNDIEELKGNIPAIQGGNLNEGILGFLKLNLNFLYINEPCLTLARVGSAGSINFFEKGCYIGDKAKALILKDKFKEYKNSFVYLFFKSLLNANKYRFSYGRGIISEEYKKIKIAIPINKNNEINFDYIIKYMREKEKRVYNYLYKLYSK